jgi:hypothetical protein
MYDAHINKSNILYKIHNIITFVRNSNIERRFIIDDFQVTDRGAVILVDFAGSTILNKEYATRENVPSRLGYYNDKYKLNASQINLLMCLIDRAKKITLVNRETVEACVHISKILHNMKVTDEYCDTIVELLNAGLFM